jgi:hypothetical protein
MSALGRLSRTAYRAHRLERATRNPSRYVKNRAISKGLGALGLWTALARIWR